MIPDPAIASIASVADWLIEGAPTASGPEGIIEELCERVVATGIPVWRAAMFVSTLHPEIMGRRIEWREGIGTAVGEAPYAVFNSPSFRGSPVAAVYRDRQMLRVRLDEPSAGEYPQLDDLRAEGATDYLAVPILFTSGEVHVGVWATRQPGGFAEAQIAALMTLTAPLARLTEIYALRRTAANLLDAYVGRDAGARVLGGQVRRGFSEAIEAVIWLSDMRGFTALADTVAPAELVALLNRYFDCQVPVILDHGGEVLKFMGDGLLAIFPLTGRDPEVVCAAAMQAAGEMRAAVAAMEGWPDAAETGAPRHGLALHIGELLYGNIGAAGRLDFTCIGPAVNLAARLEALAARLGRTTLVSAAFARHCCAGLAPLGEFALAGFRVPQPVYGLVDEAG